MPRSYARITTSIWNDDDFRGLDTTQQAIYFMLDSQPEISAAGTLPLTFRRWSRNASNLTPELIENELAVLAAEGHVAIDEDTEELLLVKFVKWDGGYTNSKRIPVIRDAALAIASPILRAALAIELRKLGLSDIASALDGNTATDALSPSRRVGVTLGDKDPNPQPATPEREPSAENAGPPSMFCPQHPAGTTDKCGPCGTARRMFDAWNVADAERVQQQKDQARTALRRCRRCNDVGFIEAADGSPVERCNHHLEVVS